MRKIYVPITTRLLTRVDKNKILKQLKQINPEYVFIGIGSPKTNPDEKKAELELLRESCEFLKSEGFKTCIWLWAFLIPGETSWQRIVDLKGDASTTEVCSLDEGYQAFYTGYIKDLASYANPDMILLDDDFAFGHNVGIGIACACPLHLKMMSDMLGEELTLDGLEEKIFCGKPNKYRDVYIRAIRDSLIGFADLLRSALDTVSPKTRLGVCSLMSAWNTDGVDSYEIARHLAGDTKPFVRLIGAPYWGVDKLFGNNRLQDVINLQRMEASWEHEGVEVLHEGDVYPRPRFATPASFMEAYDMTLLADGNADGILKYIIDFSADTEYETGYLERHLHNENAYRWIVDNMRDKPATGVRVYEFMHTVRSANLPEEYPGYEYIQHRFNSPAAKMLSACSVPLTYKGEGCCGIAFGENVRYLSEEQIGAGLITDSEGAKILEEMGFDTGVRSRGETFTPFLEYYNEYQTHVAVRETSVQKVTLDPKAEVLSDFVCGNERTPASYYYTNDKGYKFLIFTFDAYRCDDSVYRKYTRSRQLLDASDRLNGNKLPAKIHGNPDLYVMTKQEGNTLTVGLWNLFPDSVIRPVIELDGEYSSISSYDGCAMLRGDKVKLSEIPAYGFALFSVTKSDN